MPAQRAAHLPARLIRRVAGHGAQELVDDLGVQRERGEALAGLVVQLQGDAAAFVLLRLEHTDGRFAVGVRQAVEHLVEGAGQRARVGIGHIAGGARLDIAILDGADGRQHAVERREGGAQQQEVDEHADDGGERDEGRINQVMVRLRVVLGDPPARGRADHDDGAVGDDHALERGEPAQARDQRIGHEARCARGSHAGGDGAHNGWLPFKMPQPRGVGPATWRAAAADLA